MFTFFTQFCRRDPFYIGKQVLFSVFTGFSYRKDFELKDELNWVMGQLHAAGFWDKWNSDQFVREVREKKIIIFPKFYLLNIKDFSTRVCRQNPKETTGLSFLLPSRTPWTQSLRCIPTPLTGNNMENSF